MTDRLAGYLTVREEHMNDDIVRVFRAYGGHDCYEKCAFDKPECRRGSGGYHGIGSLYLYFAVAVPGRGAVSLELHTPLYPRTVLERGAPDIQYRPLGVVDLHYSEPPDYLREHGPKKCDLIDGECWTDCTYLAADDGYDMLLSGGEKAVWSWLAEKWLPDTLHPAPSHTVTSDQLAHLSPSTIGPQYAPKDS